MPDIPVGIVTLIGGLISALVLYGGARLTRQGSKEANQTTGWDNLVKALQIDNAKLEKRLSELETKLTAQTVKLSRRELNGKFWSYWARQVVAIAQQHEIELPPVPEEIEDTNPAIPTVTGESHA